MPENGTYHELNHNSTLTILFYGLDRTGVDSLPSNVVNVNFVEITNPSERNITKLQVGKNYTLPTSANDNNLHRNFVILNEIPNGYYLVNLLAVYPKAHTIGIFSEKAIIGTQPVLSPEGAVPAGHGPTSLGSLLKAGTPICTPSQMEQLLKDSEKGITPDFSCLDLYSPDQSGLVFKYDLGNIAQTMLQKSASNQLLSEHSVPGILNRFN
jgi:hypothetical protein